MTGLRVEDEWLLTPWRLALHLPTATGVIADLHLGYDQARRRAGEAVPEIDLEQILVPLRSALSQGVRRLVVAGDLFEAGPRAELTSALQTWLLAEGVESLTVVPGNHDRHWKSKAEPGLRICPEGERVARWLIIHGDQGHPQGPIVQGHEHPWFRWNERIGAPCYLVRHDHLVLPAFSNNARGVNVLRQARWSSYRCAVVVGEEVLDFGPLEGSLTDPRRRV
jgi:uncharacterized protein